MRGREKYLEKTLTGLSGGLSRGRENPESMNYDQLYNIVSNPEETRNLARNPEFSGKRDEMRQLLTTELKRFHNRPYGEFVPGGNAMPAGSCDDILEAMRKLMGISGNSMKQQKQDEKTNQQKPAETGNSPKKAERQARKAAQKNKKK
jgi:hypothetical protein